MSKEAILIILDVGPFMCQKKEKEEFTSLDKALKAVEQILQQKIIDNRKSDVCSLVAFNTSTTMNHLATKDEYLNVKTEFEFEPASVQMLKTLEDLELGTENVGDVIDALVVGTDLMLQFCGTKKFDKKIFILTDCKCQLNDSGLDQIVAKLKECAAQVNFIALNNFIDSSSDDSTAKNNFVVLKQVAEQIDGNVFEISEALELLSVLTKRTRTTTIQCPLRITESFSINLKMAAKTMPLRLPTAKKLHENAAVERSVSHFADELIDKSDLVKAYRYGKTLVPVHKIDEARNDEERSMMLIGFCPSDRIRRDSLMNNVFLIEQDEALAAFCRAMWEKDQVAIVRYVRAKNANPKLGMLIAAKTKLYFSILPFADDVRRFTFPSINKQPTNEQASAMQKFIESNSIEFTLGKLFNPTYQNVFKHIRKRALDPNNIKIENADIISSQKSLESLHDVFKLEKLIEDKRELDQDSDDALSITDSKKPKKDKY